jgi:hypothetical protein
MEPNGDVVQASVAGCRGLQIDGRVRHGPEALLGSGMQRRWVITIVCGIFAIIALFVASALLPPTFLAVALMVVVILAFGAVALLWRGE